jgi:hypothetical protein
MCASLGAIPSNPQGVVKAKACPCGGPREDPSACFAPGGALPGRPRLGRASVRLGRMHQERTRWDPKDGDLCPARTKPGETLVEVRRDSDVQIDRLSWV